MAALKLLLIGIVLSYSCAIGQTLDLEFFIDLRFALQDYDIFSPKHPGLSATPVALVYFVSFATLFVIGYISGQGVTVLLVFTAIAVLVGASLGSKAMIFTIGLISTLDLMSRSNVARLFLLLLFTSAIVIVLLQQEMIYDLIREEERYWARRIGYFVLLYDDLVPTFKSWVEASSVGAFALFDGLSSQANAVSEYSFHEINLRGLTHFSFLSTAMLVIWLLIAQEIYIFYKKNCFEQTNLITIQRVLSGLRYGLASLIILSFFHNAGLFSGDLVTFVIFGVFLRFVALESSLVNE